MASRIFHNAVLRGIALPTLVLSTTVGGTLYTSESDWANANLSPWIPIRIFRPNDYLEIAFDVRTRTPVYVMERLTVTDETTNTDQRRHRFYEEKSLPEWFRSRNSHYHLSGYDRGHMAPAADFQDNRSDTYNLINIAPQSSDMNRGVWAGLEKWTRGVARRAKQQQYETYVVTGPLWLPQRKLEDKLFEYQYKGLGNPPSLVSVPTHLFKVVVVVDPNQPERAYSIREFACFVVPNEKLPEKSDYQDFLVRWTDLEAVTGLTFFPGLVDESWRNQADKATEKLKSRQKGPLLLLTDGYSTQSTSFFKMAKVEIMHLCRDGRCSRSSKQ
ncbi:endonuclease G, mitochondrial [Fistulifera solaris]|uniref:Endonuclease n=1 Tax=Fistulifera solaris TaxID=1519565 RepID=A0A1Z5J977_FISSO|nr:endonuclease G, mitochondrial [Fistulifera solaris]|eukprot:GAX10535.1 endonuclease G, mitochondrial [Fistulifera solaris]